MRQRILLSEDDCEALALLMQKGFSFHDALHLIENMTNKECILSIEKEALSGKKLNQIMADRMPGSLKSYVQGFSTCMTLAESISAAIEIHRNEQALKQKLMKELLYPFLLSIGVMAGIFLFSNTILPSLISMMASFHSEETGLLHVQRLIHVMTGILLGVGITLAVGALWLLSPAHIVETMKKISVFRPSSLLSQYASILFVRYYLSCAKRHVPTRIALHAIRSLNDNPLPSAIAEMLDKELQTGEQMKTAVEKVCLEEKLISFFKIAMEAGESCAMLEGYLAMAEKRAEKQVRAFSKTMQIICYTGIGFVLILIYRILMTPMQLLKTI